MRPAFSLVTAAVAVTVTVGLVMGPPAPPSSSRSGSAGIAAVSSERSDEGAAARKSEGAQRGAAASAQRRESTVAAAPRLVEPPEEQARAMRADVRIASRARVARARGVAVVSASFARRAGKVTAARDTRAAGLEAPSRLPLWAPALTYVELQVP